MQTPQISGAITAISTAEARRLALNRAGLLKPEWTRMPMCVRAGVRGARNAAHRIIDRFGYLQIDTVSVAGARSHVIVLLSRITGFDPETAEQLLQPGEPLFEYWGHEASWMPLTLYPTFAFRRKEFRRHPWWGDVIGRYPKAAEDLRRRIRFEGPIRSIDMDGRGSRGWWDQKIARRIAAALWSAGELAIVERRHFHRIFDLTERVIPDEYRRQSVPKPDAISHLLLLALSGHGWATTGTLAQTWRLRRRDGVASALKRLMEKGDIIPCHRVDPAGNRKTGWIRPGDLEVAARLKRVRPRKDRGVLLSPLIPCCGIENGCGISSPSTRYSKSSNRLGSGSMGTTVYRFLPGTASWPEPISKPNGRRASFMCSPSDMSEGVNRVSHRPKTKRPPDRLFSASPTASP